jgi:hypothetical protein
VLINLGRSLRMLVALLEQLLEFCFVWHIDLA